MAPSKAVPKIELVDKAEFTTELAALLILAAADILGKPVVNFETGSKFTVKINGAPWRSYISDVPVSGMSAVQHVVVSSFASADDEEFNLEYELHRRGRDWLFKAGTLKYLPRD